MTSDDRMTPYKNTTIPTKLLIPPEQFRNQKDDTEVFTKKYTHASTRSKGYQTWDKRNTWLSSLPLKLRKSSTAPTLRRWAIDTQDSSRCDAITAFRENQNRKSLLENECTTPNRHDLSLHITSSSRLQKYKPKIGRRSRLTINAWNSINQQARHSDVHDRDHHTSTQECPCLPETLTGGNGRMAQCQCQMDSRRHGVTHVSRDSVCYQFKPWVIDL